MNKHTPGPWAERPPSRHFGGDYTIIHSGDDGDEDSIAHVWEPHNARLIAAAPEMLEALRAAAPIMSESDYGDSEWGDPDGWEAYGKVVAAIEKAEGREP